MQQGHDKGGQGHTNLISWMAGSRAHFPLLGGREKI
jgi:hypothetical protein